MSVLSMVALRMVTQEGLSKCLRIYDELKNRGSNAGERITVVSTTSSMSATHDGKPTTSKSARRRIRRRKLRESRQDDAVTMVQDTKKSRENEGENAVDETATGLRDLVTHADKRIAKDFLERSLMAAFLLKCLQRVGFFANPSGDDGTYQTLYAFTVIHWPLYLT